MCFAHAANRSTPEDLAIGLMRPPLNVDIEWQEQNEETDREPATGLL
jgi:hypothetical protein